MTHGFKRVLILLASACLISAIANADQLPIGYISWNETSRNTGEFDIINQTGPNSSGDATWPVNSTIDLSSLSLTVDFSNNTTEVFGSSYFSLSVDGISFDGATIATGFFNPKPIEAILTGTFSPLGVTLFDGSTANILSTFSATIESSAGAGHSLIDGNFAIIEATTVPEPSSLLLIAVLLAVLLLGRRDLRMKLKGPAKGSIAVGFFLCVMLFTRSESWAVTSVKLDAATAPSSGGAGLTHVNVTGSGFPSGVTAPDVIVTIATSCGGMVAAITTATSVELLTGSSDRIHFLLPHSLGTGNYYVSVASPAGSSPAYMSSNCSEVQVTHTTVATFCAPGSSLGVHAPLLGPATVTAYVPRGAWRTSSTGLVVKQIESAGGAPQAGLPEKPIATRQVVNSCGADPASGKVVCISNKTDVYILRDANLTDVLTSGATASANFSGGSCMTCGLAIDTVKNLAIVTVGLLDSPSSTGVQFLYLDDNTFHKPIPLAYKVSEDINIDPARTVILSPDESGVYDLIPYSKRGGIQEHAHIVGAGEFDSAAEDCSTGIGLSSIEFQQQVYLTDLTQAVFTPGTPGTWTAPQALVPLNTGDYAPFSAGTSGIAVSPGDSHLAAVSGEFGGNTIAVLQLPSTSGSGKPALVDYAVAALPGGYSAGLDPHTMTAYTSPNNGKAYGLFADGNFAPPSGLWVVDLEALLSAPRDPKNPHSVDPTYDLVTHSIVTIIPL